MENQHTHVFWFRYVDDTFVIWPHGKEKLTEFLNHLSELHTNIQVTMEQEEEGHLPFLDTDIYRKTDGSLSHRVYRKPTHTNLYLHQNSHHYPANNQSWLPWYTEPKLSVTRIPLFKNWNFLPLFSRIMHTALGRFDEPLNLQHGLPRPTKNLPRAHSYLTPRQPVADSAECWQNTKSKVSLCH
jgi:hypothetical protein